jgi:hypothetical protein
MTRTPLAALALLAGLAAGLAVAAPPPKETKGEEKLPPPTAEQWRQAQQNMSHIGLAVHNYHDVNGKMPNNVANADGKHLLSWRVLLLPYLEEDTLYREFKLDEAWDSDHNKKLAEKLPKVYAPVRAKAKAGETFLRGFDGPGAAFEKGAQLRLLAFTDGTSNTLLVVEAKDPVVWTKPDDLPFDPAKDLPKLGGQFDGEFHMVMADGAPRRVRKDFNPATLKLVIQRADGNPVNLESLAPDK